MANNLTKKEKGFVKDFVEHGNATKAVGNNYGTTSDNTAASIGSRILKKEKIQKAIRSIAEQIPDSLLVKRHLELLNVPKIITTKVRGEITDIEESVDTQAISKGLDMAYKIKGTYAPEKKEIIMEPLSDEAKEKARQFDEWYAKQP